MYAGDFINASIPQLRKGQSVDSALLWMQEFHLSHLPFVVDGKCLALYSEEDLMALRQSKDDLDPEMGQAQEFPFVFAQNHWLRVLRMMGSYQLSLLPVLNAREKFMGSIPLTDFMVRLGEMSFIRDPGAVIVLDMSYRDLVLSELMRLIEQEDARVLHLITDKDPGQKNLRVTLKVYMENPEPLVQSLERHGYQLVGNFAIERGPDKAEENYSALMRYLNI